VCTRAQGVDAPLDRPHAERDAAATYKSQGQNLGMVAVTALCNGKYLLTKVLVARRAGMVSRLVAGARSSSSVPRAALSVLDERGRPFFCEEESPPNHTRGGRHVGLGIRLTGFVRNTATEVSGRALLLHPTRGRGLAVPGSRRKRSIPHARPTPKPPK
jgi:hypothetical protein